VADEDNGKNWLTDEDVLVLRELVGWYRTRNRSTFNTSGRPAVLKARAAEDIAEGASGSAVLLDVTDPKGSESDGDTVEVWAILGDVSAGSILYITPVGGGYEVINAQCPGV
jgi:hypothetical protein